MYKVIERFMDLQDDNYIYEVGDAYPREGADPTLERIRELASNSNKIGKPLIEEIAEKPKKKAVKKVEKTEE